MNPQMNKKILILVFALFQTCFSLCQEAWVLTRESDGIKVFTKKEGSYKFETFKATVTINTSVNNFISVLNNIEIFPKWGHNIKSANLLERSGDTLQIYYSEAKAPFPYKNRDGIYLNRFKWFSETKTLMVDIEVLDGYLDLDEKYVRVKGYGYWEIKELPNNKIDVIFSMQIDPGGSIPSWLANMFVTDTPFKTLLNLKELLESEGFEKHSYNFIN